MIANNELERIWKEEVIAKFEILFQHWPEKTEQIHENTSLRIIDVLDEI
jgi:hypothetical protein